MYVAFCMSASQLFKLTDIYQAFPDVAAQSVNFLIFFEGSSGLVDGTSAASPTFAGIVSLLNDARIRAGKSPLGFLNPLFYSLKSGFNDITTGNNPGCGTPGFNVSSSLPSSDVPFLTGERRPSRRLLVGMQ